MSQGAMAANFDLVWVVKKKKKKRKKRKKKKEKRKKKEDSWAGATERGRENGGEMVRRG